MAFLLEGNFKHFNQTAPKFLLVYMSDYSLFGNLLTFED